MFVCWLVSMWSLSCCRVGDWGFSGMVGYFCGVVLVLLFVVLVGVVGLVSGL